MKKAIIATAFSILLACSFVNAEERKLFGYIPDDGEIQYYMNFYERLRSIENGKQDFKQLSSIFTSFENKEDRYYETYQRLLLEAYLRTTTNSKVKKYMSDYFQTLPTGDKLIEAITRLWSGKLEEYVVDSQKQNRFRLDNDLIDENINMFTMNESQLLNGEIGLMLFDNPWAKVSVDMNKDRNSTSTSLITGGGTNSMSITIKATPNLLEDEFASTFLDTDFYKKRFEKYSVQEVPKTGVLARAGAERIFFGIGSGSDTTFPMIRNFSVVMFMYSAKRHTGYRIDYFMNISPKNNNFDTRDHLYNQMIFQAYLTYLN